MVRRIRDAAGSLWDQVRGAVPALAVIATVATAGYTAGATRGHAQIAIRDRLLDHQNRLERLEADTARTDSSIRASHESITLAIDAQNDVIEDLALQVCLLRLEQRGLKNTEACAGFRSLSKLRQGGTP